MATPELETKTEIYNFKFLHDKIKTCIEATEKLALNSDSNVKKEIAIQMVMSGLEIRDAERSYYHEMISDMIEGIFDIKNNGLNVNSSAQRSMCWNGCFLFLQSTKPKKE
jgi:hypothetical protein